LFFAASLAVYFLAAIYSYNPCSRQFHSDPPIVTSGDEPHYLIMISSLVMDGDLNLGNNYESARRGGFDAGQRRIARNLDHHTLVIDRRTGETALWASMFGLENEPCEPAEPDCTGYNRVTNRFPDYTPNNPNFAERPWHSVPFPALLALLLSGSRQEAFEARAVYLVVMISWLAGLVTYACCLKLGLGKNWSLAAVAVLLFASPWFVYSHGLFAMTFLGLLLISALLALLYERFTIAAVLITIASMQSEAFVIIIPAWVVYLYFIKQKRAALTLGIAGIASVVVASLINKLLLGKVSLRGMWFMFSPVLWKVFVEPQSGVLLFFPWCLVVFLFLGVLLLNLDRNRHRQVMLIAAGFLPMAGIYFFMPDTGGSGYGPRYWVPHLPWLSILLVTAAKEYWNVKPLLLRPILLVLIGLSTVIATMAAVLNRSEKLIWVKPPWYAAKMLLWRDEPSYRELLCPESSTIWLGIGCDKTASERGTITTPEAIRATTLEVVSRLACATQIAEGTEVLRVTVFDAQGYNETVSMVAGRDSSEWSYDCKATRTAVRHSRAPVVASYAAGLDKESCEGHRYLATLRFGKPANVQKLQFEWVAGEAAIMLDRLTLKDETTGETFLIDPALFKP
jgi:hypothetical protein